MSVATATVRPSATAASSHTNTAVRSSVLLAGRALLSAIFLAAAPGHFSAGTIQYAAGAGVPFAEILVPASGVLALVSSLALLAGFQTRFAALGLVLFLVPVTLSMHAFWNVADPMARQMQYLSFLKNASILGGVLLVSQIGAGPWSIDGARVNSKHTAW